MTVKRLTQPQPPAPKVAGSDASIDHSREAASAPGAATTGIEAAAVFVPAEPAGAGSARASLPTPSGVAGQAPGASALATRIGQLTAATGSTPTAKNMEAMGHAAQRLRTAARAIDAVGGGVSDARVVELRAAMESEINSIRAAANTLDPESALSVLQAAALAPVLSALVDARDYLAVGPGTGARNATAAITTIVQAMTAKHFVDAKPGPEADVIAGLADLSRALCNLESKRS